MIQGSIYIGFDFLISNGMENTNTYCVLKMTCPIGLYVEVCLYSQKYQNLVASAGSRTRIDCLEGNHANRYTTDAGTSEGVQNPSIYCMHSITESGSIQMMCWPLISCRPE